jgi:hypothetical protein
MVAWKWVRPQIFLLCLSASESCNWLSCPTRWTPWLKLLLSTSIPVSTSLAPVRCCRVSRTRIYSQSSSIGSEVARTFEELVKPIAKKYSLYLDGVSYSKRPSIGNITFTWVDPHDPSPISPARAGNVAWDVFSKAVQASFGQDVITAPSAMTGNTGGWNIVISRIIRWHYLHNLRYTSLRERFSSLMHSAQNQFIMCCL